MIAIARRAALVCTRVLTAACQTPSRLFELLHDRFRRGEDLGLIPIGVLPTSPHGSPRSQRRGPDRMGRAGDWYDCVLWRE